MFQDPVKLALKRGHFLLGQRNASQFSYVTDVKVGAAHGRFDITSISPADKPAFAVIEQELYDSMGCDRIEEMRGCRVNLKGEQASSVGLLRTGGLRLISECALVCR